MKNVRIFYSKKGRMKFVSHLDMNRFMSRLVNKAKLPIWFTEGFNQHAYFNFAVPLTLGFEGEYEILDIKITDDNYSSEQLLKDLNAASIPDIVFWKASEPVLKMKEITFAEFKISFDGLGSTDEQKIKDFFARKSVITKKTTKKGGTKDIDIVPLIKKAELTGNELSLILTAGNENNLNPVLVINAMFEFEKIKYEYSVIRTMIYDKNMQPFV